MKPGRFVLGAASTPIGHKSKKTGLIQHRFLEPLESRVLLSGSVAATLDTIHSSVTTPQVVVPFTSTGTVQVQGNSETIVKGEDAPIIANFTDFGGTDSAGSTPVTRTYTINNTGTGTLTMIGANPVSISGTNMADFTVSAQAGSSVAAGSSTTFTITFTPSAAGLRTAQVSIITSDPTSPFTFDIQGTGLVMTTIPVIQTGTTNSFNLLTNTTGVGTGTGAANNDILVMSYSGYQTDGTLFDASAKDSVAGTFEFDIGVGQVIQGWDSGLVGLQVGQSRTLIIPSGLAYPNGNGPSGTLIFTTTLLNIISAGGEVSGSFVAIPDSDTIPSSTNATSFGTLGVGALPVTHTFQINDPGGNLNTLLATPQVTTTGSTAFTITQPTFSAGNTTGTFTVTYTPGFGSSTATVTLVTTATNPPSGSQNFTFTVSGSGPNPDDGSVTSATAADITGFAYDPTTITTTDIPDKVEVIISGGPAPQTITANLASPELKSTFGTVNNDFDYAMPVLSVGSHAVQVYAINSTTGVKTLLATETVVSQNSLFDSHYYLMENPDVAAAVTAGTIATAYDHYIQYGQYEGRSPSPYWNEAWYLQENPDVAAAVKAGRVSSGFMHYYLYGQYENRPGVLYFNENYYLAHNPDVAAAVASGALTSGFEHYVLFGQYEGRSPLKYFSQTVYNTYNTDIGPYVTGEPMTSDYEQFVIYGQYEDRIASAYYNETIYLADNPDVAAAVRDGEFLDGFQHWLEYGQYEGRTAV